METKVTFVSGKNELTANAKLAQIVEACFVPSSAAANVSGLVRAEIAELFAKNLQALGKFDHIRIETEDEIITVDNKDMTNVLKNVADACKKNDAYRESVKVHNAVYESARTITVKNPDKKENRGRKGMTTESRFAEAFTL